MSTFTVALGIWYRTNHIECIIDMIDQSSHMFPIMRKLGNVLGQGSNVKVTICQIQKFSVNIIEAMPMSVFFYQIYHIAHDKSIFWYY